MAMRLDYFVAHATGLSRKAAKALIRDGAIRVEGTRTALRANTVVGGDKAVYWQDQPLSLPGHHYLMLHKPPGVISATRDDQLPTVLDLLPATVRRDLHPVGRLDRDTTGLVLLSTDGQWSHRIASPNGQCAKRYRVTTAAPLEDEQLRQLRAGVVLRDDPAATRPARAEPVAACVLLLTISEGRYHQVKRMLAAVGNRVVALHREAVGAIELDAGLAPGDWRALTREEIETVGGS